MENLKRNFLCSKNELKNDLCSFINFLKDNKLTVILCWFFLLLSYGIKLFWYSINIDTDIALNNMPWTLKWWMSIDRSGLVFTKKLFNLLPLNPYVEVFLMFCTVFLALMILCFLFNYVSQKTGFKSKVEFILPCVFITQPLMEDQFNFTLQTFEFSFALLLMFISVFMITRWVLDSKNILHLLCAGILLTWAFWSYQAIIFLCFAVILSVFICMYAGDLRNAEKTECNKTFFRAIAIKYATFFISVFFVYFIANKLVGLFFELFKDNYLNNMFLWNKQSFAVCLNNILGYVLKCLIITKALYGVLAILLFILAHSIIKTKKSNRLLFCMAMLGLVASPFILSIYLGNTLLPRMQITLSFVMAFILYFLAQKVKLKFVKKIVVIASLMLTFRQSYIVSGLLYSEYMRYQSEVALANKISERISNLNIENIKDTPVDFVGIMNPVPTNLKTRNGTTGSSFFECWSSGTGVAGSALSFMKTIGLEYKGPDEEDHKKAKEIAKTMKSWPSSEAVKYQNNIIVVKLSEEPSNVPNEQPLKGKVMRVIEKVKKVLRLA